MHGGAAFASLDRTLSIDTPNPSTPDRKTVARAAPPARGPRITTRLRSRSREFLRDAVVVAVLVIGGLVARHYYQKPPSLPRATRGPIKRVFPLFTSDKTAILELLRERRFDDLDLLFDDYHRKATENPVLGANEDHAYDSFTVPDSRVELLINDWIAASPRSYAAQMAMSNYQSEIANNAYFDNWDGVSGNSGSEVMRKSAARGIEHARAALALKPDLAIAYGTLIFDNAILDRLDQARKLGDEGLKKMPASYPIRSAYIYALSPIFKGSYREMNEFAERSQAFRARNPLMQTLLGAVDVDTARTLLDKGSYRGALDAVNRALEAGGDDPHSYFMRGEIYYAVGMYNEALADLQRANELVPQIADYLRMMAYTYYQLDRPREALAAIESFSNLGEPDHNILAIRDWASAKAGH